jgi:hypothetical protein
MECLKGVMQICLCWWVIESMPDVRLARCNTMKPIARETFLRRIRASFKDNLLPGSKGVIQVRVIAPNSKSLTLTKWTGCIHAFETA